MIDPRPNIGLAIDGGGIRGLIVARGLTALEAELGSTPLIDHPQIKVLAGTSTGALIAGGIALGLSAAEITTLYLKFAQAIFPPLPDWIPLPLQGLLKNIIGLFKPSFYDNLQLKNLVRTMIAQKTGNPDLTLRELRERLRPDQALLITTLDITERRTHFLKTYDEADGDWMLWEAVLASSSAPTFFPVFTRKGRYYTDGGVGSYGNPAYVVAREAVDWMKYAPHDVTVFSFGTGWVNDTNFERTYGTPDQWRILKWAQIAPFLIVADAARAESLDIIERFTNGYGLDLRRFQIELATDIGLDDTRDATLTQLQQLGDVLAQRIHDDQHALGTSPAYDPEGLRDAVQRYQISQQRAQARTVRS